MDGYTIAEIKLRSAWTNYKYIKECADKESIPGFWTKKFGTFVGAFFGEGPDIASKLLPKYRNEFIEARNIFIHVKTLKDSGKTITFKNGVYIAE